MSSLRSDTREPGRSPDENLSSILEQEMIQLLAQS